MSKGVSEVASVQSVHRAGCGALEVGGGQREAWRLEEEAGLHPEK